MADIAHATRIEPLAGRAGGGAGVALVPLTPAVLKTSRVAQSQF